MHMPHNSIIALRPAYALTKASGTLAAQLLSNTVAKEKVQVVSFHPGMIYGEGWVTMGIAKEALPFDDGNFYTLRPFSSGEMYTDIFNHPETLPGGFAVWAASPEAAFLHGRYVFASWDVTELAQGELRASIDNDPSYLTIGVIGLKGVKRA
jgi:NAD(P)-dependent dehydrogenase (short-subunit alcohol dehydrogenase family)